MAGHSYGLQNAVPGQPVQPCARSFPEVGWLESTRQATPRVLRMLPGNRATWAGSPVSRQASQGSLQEIGNGET